MSNYTWTAIDLANVRTDVLRSLDLRNGPPAARRVVLAELSARQWELTAEASLISDVWLLSSVNVPNPECTHRRGAINLDSGAWHCYGCDVDIFDN